MKKVKDKEDKKKRRELRLNQIDWQKHRLSDLARHINNIFVGEKKLVIKFDVLVEKVKFNRKCICSRQISDDLERLIVDSDGWLKLVGGWVRRDPSSDINMICNYLENCL